MCIIIIKNPGILHPPFDFFKECFNSNGHGIGVGVQIPDQRIEVFKTMDFDSFSAYVYTIPPEYMCIYHFRIPTSGSKTVEMCHPFTVSEKKEDFISSIDYDQENDSDDLFYTTDKPVMFHNGVIYTWAKLSNRKDVDLSDSAIFATRLMPKFITEEEVIDADIVTALAGISSKLAVLSPNFFWASDGFHEVAELKGIFASNYSYRPTPKVDYHSHGKYDHNAHKHNKKNKNKDNTSFVKQCETCGRYHDEFYLTMRDGMLLCKGCVKSYDRLNPPACAYGEEEEARKNILRGIYNTEKCDWCGKFDKTENFFISDGLWLCHACEQAEKEAYYNFKRESNRKTEECDSCGHADTIEHFSVINDLWLCNACMRKYNLGELDPFDESFTAGNYIRNDASPIIEGDWKLIQSESGEKGFSLIPEEANIL